MENESGEITRLLLNAKQSPQAEGALMEAVHARLHYLAVRHLRSERPDITLQPTALVNEFYLRVIHDNAIDWKSRTHLFAVAAQTLRRILVDHAKAQKAQRRIPKKLQFSLDDALIPASDNSEEILAIHEALEQLARLDPQQAAIVELRFFSGLSVDETAEFLGISERTVKRNWAFARAWLAVYLGKSQKPELG